MRFMTIEKRPACGRFSGRFAALRDSLRRKEGYFQPSLRHDYAAFASLRSAQAKR
jgi:hypothetical protein